MSDDNFYGPEWDLANIAANTPRTDGFLRDLIELAENGFGTAVGLLANGMIIVGTIAPPEFVAEELDRERQRLANRMGSSRPDDRSEEEWAEDLKRFASANMQLVAEIRAQEEELDERIEASGESPWDYDAPPRGLARKALETGNRSYLNLKNPQISAPGQPGIAKPEVLRVVIREIVAWWPIVLDESGQARFQLFSTDDE